MYVDKRVSHVFEGVYVQGKVEHAIAFSTGL